MKKNLFIFTLLFASLSLFSQNNTLHFDGTGDQVTFPGNTFNPQFQGASAITLEAWHYIPEAAVGRISVFSNWMTGSGFGLYTWINAGTGTSVYSAFARSSPSGAQNNSHGSFAFPNDTWIHIACVYDFADDEIRIYFDGVLQQSAAANFDPTYNNGGSSGSNLDAIGARTDRTDRKYHGEMEDFRIWTVERTQAEIAASMNAPLSDPYPAGLIAYYNFDQGIGGGDNTGISSVIDSKGSSNGTLDSFTLNGDSSNFLGSTAFPEADPVPTMGEWALIIFALMIMSMGVVTVMRWEKERGLVISD